MTSVLKNFYRKFKYLQGLEKDLAGISSTLLLFKKIPEVFIPTRLKKTLQEGITKYNLPTVLCKKTKVIKETL
ncbi:RepB family protein [Flavobacterium sp. 9R]|uniref:RepB family protein n=1 Tax=Flavobacterium sp. 9R TaxID=2653143 RepID=UPI00135B2F4E